MPRGPAHGGSRLIGAVLRASGTARQQIGRRETDLARTRTIYATASPASGSAACASKQQRSTPLGRRCGGLDATVGVVRRELPPELCELGKLRVAVLKASR